MPEIGGKTPREELVAFLEYALGEKCRSTTTGGLGGIEQIVMFAVPESGDANRMTKEQATQDTKIQGLKRKTEEFFKRTGISATVKYASEWSRLSSDEGSMGPKGWGIIVDLLQPIQAILILDALKNAHPGTYTEFEKTFQVNRAG